MYVWHVVANVLILEKFQYFSKPVKYHVEASYFRILCLQKSCILILKLNIKTKDWNEALIIILVPTFLFTAIVSD